MPRLSLRSSIGPWNETMPQLPVRYVSTVVRSLYPMKAFGVWRRSSLFEKRQQVHAAIAAAHRDERPH